MHLMCVFDGKHKINVKEVSIKVTQQKRNNVKKIVKFLTTKVTTRNVKI